MSGKKIVKRACYIFLSLIFIVLLALAVVLAVGVELDLSSQRNLVNTTFSKFLNRKVEVRGDIRFQLSLTPAVMLNGITIRNPKGFGDGVFLEAEKAELSVSVLALLARKIHIPGMELEKVRLDLENRKDGSANWVLDDNKKTNENKILITPKQIFSLAPDFLDIKSLTIRDMSISYKTWNRKEPVSLSQVYGEGSGRPDEPFDLHFTGKLGQEPFTSDIKAGSLAELLQSKVVWLSVEVEAFDTKLAYTGRMSLPMVKLSGEMQAELSGKNLSDLDTFFNLDLPPVQNYSLKSKVLLRGKITVMESLELAVGSSRLKGKATLDRTGDKPCLNSTLTATTIQLDDFRFKGWSALGQNKEDGQEKNGTSSVSIDSSDVEKVRKLLNHQSLAALDLSSKIYVDEVLSGKDRLGSGELKARLISGTLSVNPLILNIPGGSFFLTSSLSMGKDDIRSALTVVAQRFDYGVLIRRNKPDSDMAGLMTLDLDLKSKAPDYKELMGYANGQISLVVKPYNFRAGVVDLWAVNLLASVLPKFGQDPAMVNCVLMKLDVQDGIMKPQALLVDTTNVRVAGVGQVDFKDRTVSLTLAPEAKKPQFFSLSTPVHAKGHFDDFKLSVRPEDILETAIVFITSPVHVPIRRLFETYLPPDGGDVCNDPGIRPKDLKESEKAEEKMKK